jgi:hypothetical protein
LGWLGFVSAKCAVVTIKLSQMVAFRPYFVTPHAHVAFLLAVGSNRLSIASMRLPEAMANS